MKTWSFIFQRKFRKLQHLLFFSGFQWQNNRLKMVLASPNDRIYPRYPLVLIFNVTLAQPLRLVIMYFLMEILVRWSALVSSWQQMEFEVWCGWAHLYKTIAKLIVHSISFEVGIQNLVSEYILEWQSVPFHFSVTVTLTADLVSRIGIESGAYILYYLM